jgi:hypothetical protein
MIRNLKRRCYNVAGVFWSNSFDPAAEEICLLPWNELLWIENPTSSSKKTVYFRLDEIALRFSDFLIARANIQ